MYECSFYDHAPEDLLPACELTLKNLQLQYLDLYLVHTPIRVRKGATYPYSEEDKFHYDPEYLGKTWKVNITMYLDCVEMYIHKLFTYKQSYCSKYHEHI